MAENWINENNAQEAVEGPSTSVAKYSVYPANMTLSIELFELYVAKMKNQDERLMAALQQLKIDTMIELDRLKTKYDNEISQLKLAKSEHILKIRELQGQVCSFIDYDRSSRLQPREPGDVPITLMNVHSTLMQAAKHMQSVNPPTFHETVLKAKLFQFERSRIFPLPQVSSAGFASEFLDQKPDCVWTILQFKTLLDQSCSTSEAEYFTLCGYRVQAWAQLKNKDSNVTITVDLGELSTLDVSVLPRVFIVLKDRRSGEERKDVIRTQCKAFKCNTLNYMVNFSSTTLKNPLYNVDDSIQLAIYVETPFQANHVYTYFGTLFGSIDDYWNRKQMAKDKSVLHHLSPYFYTSPVGYRVQALIYLNGCEKFTNRGLTFGISFQNGEWDSKLNYSFPHVTTISIFKPSLPQKPINRGTMVMDASKQVYMVDVGTHEEVERLLDCDVLFYKVTITKLRE